MLSVASSLSSSIGSWWYIASKLIPSRHPMAGRQRRIAVGVDQPVAIGVGRDRNVIREQHGCPIEQLPRRPRNIRVRKREPVPTDCRNVDLHRSPKRVVEIAGHPVRVPDLDTVSRLIHKGRPNCPDGAGSNAGDRPADVDGHPVRLTMLEGRLEGVRVT